MAVNSLVPPTSCKLLSPAMEISQHLAQFLDSVRFFYDGFKPVCLTVRHYRVIGISAGHNGNRRWIIRQGEDRDVVSMLT